MRVAIIGIKAIPARFGGFETAVDEISRGLVQLGHNVTVYNRTGMSALSLNTYEGVRLINLPAPQSKNLSTICHAFLSTLHAMFRRSDVVHYFTTGATLFAPLVRMTGKKVICSVDGTDWQRAKWGPLARFYLRLSERLAVFFCDRLISDSKEVADYYWRNYRAASTCITYGMREQRSTTIDTLRRLNLSPREYVLFVGRLVPENNVHQLIRAFEATNTHKKLVIVGDDPWEKRYVQSLKETRDSRIVFTGGVYGDGYVQLQQNAYLFVLPDEVGGTHPALVEAMGYGNCVLVNDTPSNLEVIGQAGVSYAGNGEWRDLRRKLCFLLDDPDLVTRYRQLARERALMQYRWSDVIERHALLYEAVLMDNKRTDSATVAKRAA
jgi:glycosyltransferase involved in cell wall biosynthesis